MDNAYELKMLRNMEPYDLRVMLVDEDLEYWRNQFDIVNSRLASLHKEEHYYIAMAKQYLQYYNDESREEDWIASQQYTALAEQIREYRKYLRGTLTDIETQVRRYKKEWQQVTKMAELQRKLTSETQSS